ncbi:MAG: hydroxymethylglutaryl-CoA synthase, partial [Acidobacteriota bacterium]
MTTQTSPQTPAIGLASIGLSLPPLALPVEELAKLRGQDPAKFTLGLGCREMALCPEDFGAVEMAAEAARRALGRWGGDLDQIGMIVVGTESAVDMSRPLSAWVADALDLRGAVRSYEVKHACYGGTLALRQALEWKLSGAAGDKAALVIATDVALYALQDPGEPTQGAGAVAMVVDDA